MDWFNYLGLIFISVMMIPNVVFMFKKNESHNDAYHNKIIELFEQIGRYSCFFLMVFNIPYTYYGFWFSNALIVYILINSSLLLFYLIVWVICWNAHKLFRSYALSISPSIMFLSSAIILAYYPLIVLSVLFAICHITISLKNAYGFKK
jgi:hypothetical protein